MKLDLFQKMMKKIKELFIGKAWLNTKVYYEIDHEDEWIENGRLSLIWYVAKCRSWQKPNKVWSSAMFDSSTGKIQMYSMGFNSIKECLEWIRSHPKVIDIYREYVRNPRLIKNIRKSRLCQKRQEILIKYVKNHDSLPSQLKHQYIIKGQ